MPRGEGGGTSGIGSGIGGSGGSDTTAHDERGKRRKPMRRRSRGDMKSVSPENLNKIGMEILKGGENT